jgi:hypothetical protein
VGRAVRQSKEYRILHLTRWRHGRRITSGNLPARAPTTVAIQVRLSALGAAGTEAPVGCIRLLGCNVVEQLVGQEDEVAGNGPVADESHGYRVTGSGEEPIAVPDYDRVKHQP